mgnify:FL=1
MPQEKGAINMDETKDPIIEAIIELLKEKDDVSIYDLTKKLSEQDLKYPPK